MLRGFYEGQNVLYGCVNWYYDARRNEELPHTNNGLESLFRDIQRRLLRTTGQKGQTRRAMQRTVGWELPPRPPTEDECLDALRQVSPTQLANEQQRLRQHRERFRLHTRSIRRTNAQFDKLRQP